MSETLTPTKPDPATNPAQPASGPPAGGPSPGRILGLSWGLARTATLVAGLDLDVFGAIANGLDDVEAIAAARGTDLRCTAALLSGLEALGLVSQDAPGQFRLAPDAAAYLVPGMPHYLGDLRHMYHELNVAVWPHLTAVVRDGGPPRELFAVDATSLWAKVTPYLDALGDAAVRSMAPQLADRLPAAPAIADVGCGSGGYGRALVDVLPGARVVGFDRPGVAEVATVLADASGLERRCRYVGGDLLELPWEGPHDLVLLSNVLHGYDAERCVELLRKARASLTPNGTLAIVEILPTTDAAENPVGALFGLQMVLTSEGNAHRADDYTGWLAAAGFGAPTVDRVPNGPLSLLLAGPAPSDDPTTSDERTGS